MSGIEKNSFKQLEKEQEKEYSGNLEKVKNSIDGNLSGLSFFTNVIDIYFARVVSYMVSMTSGGKTDKDDHEP